jgi:protein ImuB
VFAVVYIPNFFLQAALRSEPELRHLPVALVDAPTAKATILQATAAAAHQGAGPGLTVPQAAARCPGLLIKNRNAAQELSATETLWQSAYAFSPGVESTAPGVCTVDLKGLRLESETAARTWGMKLAQRLAQFHLEAQIGFGPTPRLALLMAHAARPVLWKENPREFVAGLPIAALRPAPEIARVLELWGIQTVGALAALGKDQMARRLGRPVLDLLDSLEAVPPLKLAAPPETFVERMDFERPIETAEPLLFVLNRFLEQLRRRLEAVYLVVAELRLRLTLASGASYERVFKIPSPTNNSQILFRMLQTHLENVRTDSPIVALHLGAEPGKPERHQFGLFEATLRDPNQFAETLARLTALCGAENAGTPQLLDSHRPDAFRMKTPEFSGPKAPLRAETAGAHPRQGLRLRRFRPPVAAQVEFRGEQPAVLRSRSCQGAVLAWQGPFANSGQWWEPSASWAREEWDVQLAGGGLYRIFLAAGECFVEGVYD